MRFLPGLNRRLVIVAALGILVAGLLSVGATTPAAASATWSIVPSPNTGTGDNSLNGVSCISVNSCKALGQDGGGIAQQTLIESWDGTKWSIDPTPSSTTSSNTRLLGVSCASTASCKAVGQYVFNNGIQALIESWDGNTWSVDPSPSLGNNFNLLNGVTCVSSNACTAVGENVYSTLVESWNGTGWSVVLSPNGPNPEGQTAYNIFKGVSCISSSSCKAVGVYDLPGVIRRPFIESWNGTAWKLVSSPLPTNNDRSELLSVSCVSAHTCNAVGANALRSGTSQSLIESWNGTKWAFVTHPNTGFLSGVSCVSAHICTAVGPEIESWNGTKWSIVPSPNTGTDVLSGVSCISASSCKAVGTYLNNVSHSYQTLIESYG